MPKILVDTHSHIQFPVYDEDRKAVISRASEAGVAMIAVGTQASTSESAIEAVEKFSKDIIGATVGFHPNHLDVKWRHDPKELKAAQQEKFDIKRLEELAKHSRVLAIGECGLDYYRLQDEDLAAKTRQKEVFRKQIKLAQELNKPLIVHCRSAFADLINIIKSHWQVRGSVSGVVHFFSGSWQDAKELLDLGFYLGFGGVITFASDYDEIVKKVPLERILLETDAPYVSPLGHRGQRNEPVFMIETAQKLAELKLIKVDEAYSATTANALRLFRFVV